MPRGMSLSFTRCTSVHLTLKRRGDRARSKVPLKNCPTFGTGHQCRGSDAGHGVLGRLFVGLQSGASLCRREYLRRAGCVQAIWKAAHEHGIAVIIDVVYNHLGPPTSVCGGLTVGAKTRKGESTSQRSSLENALGRDPPRLGRGEVRQYVRDNALMWFEEYHADGLRWDMIAYIGTSTV